MLLTQTGTAWAEGAQHSTAVGSAMVNYQQGPVLPSATSIRNGIGTKFGWKHTFIKHCSSRTYTKRSSEDGGDKRY